MSTYPHFDTMPIGTAWRPGSSDNTRAVTDPYTGDTLTELAQADEGDLDEAYSAAVAAQPDWAEAPPGERAAVLRAAADVMTARQDEVVDWLIRETGGTRAKAELEWGLVRSVMWEAASMPHHVEGRIMPSDIPGKESRVYRQPVGVVAVISPWNFPMQLSNRSVAPALAVGNAVVLKPAGDTPSPGVCCWQGFSRRRGCRQVCCRWSSGQARTSGTRSSNTRFRAWCRSPDRHRSARASPRRPG